MLVGFDTADDAAVYQLTDDLALIQTVDIFPPAVDDPFEYGQIAAANSLSDVWAMGGEAKLCMNVLMFPETLPDDAVHAIVEGGYEKVAEAGAIIVGGHTIKDNIPKYGLCVAGIVHPNHILRNNAIQEGDVLILTKGIGTGVLTNADRGELLSEAEHKALVASMAQLNKYAADAVKGDLAVHACTDVTGFGLLGHAREMCDGTGLSIVLDAASVPLLSGAFEYAAMGLVPAAAYNNRNYLNGKAAVVKTVGSALEDLLYDPQTSGGLLYSVSGKDAARIFDRIKAVCPQAAIIGYVEKGGEKTAGTVSAV